MLNLAQLEGDLGCAGYTLEHASNFGVEDAGSVDYLVFHYNEVASW
jgi:hypothetical protein